MKFELTILGVSAATPAFGRFPTAQFLQIHNNFFLIDCGEGAQMRMAGFNIPAQKIQRIFISHLHGDHFFGLPGLLYTFAMHGRLQPLFIHSPAGLHEKLSALLPPNEELGFPLHFIITDTTTSTLIFENKILSVEAFPLVHRVPATGFLFREKQPLKNIIPEKIAEWNLSISQIKAIKAGQDLQLENGQIIPNEDLTLPPVHVRSFAFVSDTAYKEDIVPIINNVDLLYHETTYLHDSLDKAELTLHSTALQAGMIAQKANVGKLICGHYSARYADSSVIVTEAKTVFPNTVAGVEGEKYTLARRKSDHS